MSQLIFADQQQCICHFATRQQLTFQVAAWNATDVGDGHVMPCPYRSRSPSIFALFAFFAVKFLFCSS